MERRGLYRQGDSDTSGDRPVSFSPNVFANGGPTLGGAIADVLGLDDTVGISDDEARSILEGIAAEQAAGGDYYLNDPLEGREVSPNTGQPPGAAPEAMLQLVQTLKLMQVFQYQHQNGSARLITT
jgi:hypothetical protein